jgi:hypothetical protein
MFQNPQDDLRGGSTTEMWEVYPTTNDVFDPNGIVVPETIFVPGATDGIPHRGDIHPIPSLGVCTGGRVSEVISNTSVIVIIFYRGYGVNGSLPNSGTRAYGKNPERVELPVWFKFQTVDPTGGNLQYYDRDDSFIWERQHVLRVETRYRPGNEASVILRAITRNLGQWYLIDGDYYILSGESTVSYNGGTTTKADYVFETWATHPGVPAGNLTFRNDIAIPALGNLHKWHSGILPDGVTPFVNLVPRDQFCAQGSFNGLPTLPGFP